MIKEAYSVQCNSCGGYLSPCGDVSKKEVRLSKEQMQNALRCESTATGGWLCVEKNCVICKECRAKIFHGELLVKFERAGSKIK